ncbi:WD repeat-containing protein 3 [Chironomus tepperi]|uniref:WD repeat-containing protein 3 n=1 Tax=Chironomus tepperi TaxID=113505 RepID=UPI00391F433D
MGVTKQYMRYKPTSIFNIIASSRANGIFVEFNQTSNGRYWACGAAENVLVWDLRTGEKVAELNRDKEEVTYLKSFENKLAAGYSDGNIVIFNLDTRTNECMFTPHKSAISCLQFDKNGLNLLSGSLDTDLVVSDLVDQAGKCRLSGHRGAVTACQFLENYENIAISSSKDMQIKFWNIETQFCFKTIVDNTSEVWGLALLRNESFLVTGCKETALRVYKLTENKSHNDNKTVSDSSMLLSDDDSFSPIRCNFVGTIQRAGRGRTVNLITDSQGQYLACTGTDDEIEIFYFNSSEESLKKLSKRLKKLSVKKDELNEDSKELSLSDEIKRIGSIKTKEKVKSIDMISNSTGEIRIGAVFGNNLIRLYSVNSAQKHPEPLLLKSISQQGHHSECRSVSFSSDNLAIASGSGESLKIWNRSSLSCLRTIETDYILSTCFVPGDRHVLLGTKKGDLIIADIVVGEILETIRAHEKELWSVSLAPNLRSCVTGGGDNTVKFWSFELINDPNNESNKVLSVIHKNTLELEENVLVAKISPDNKYIVVALLDSTVKIFFMDSFKFFLSLYGHKLPVLCFDICYDNLLIATGSADRNVKIWGMDFGDVHRSLFAHDDSVMALQFIPKTHMFFTCGKDGKIKQWDADTFSKILTLPGHIGEAFGLTISPNGRYVVTCGSDRTLRMYERSDEVLVLQDVEEEEREEAENRELATGEDSAVPGLPGLNLPSKKTVGAEKAAENILESLELGRKFDAEGSNEIPPIMQFYEATTSNDYLLGVFSKIRSSDLEESLLLLPFSNVCEILERLPKIAETRKDQIELISKVVLFLFRIHHKPIVTNQVLLPSIQKLINSLEESVTEVRDMVGENVHAMSLLQRRIEGQDKVELFKDATRARRVKNQRQKKRRIAKRLHMQIAA